jgi:hypothetical protein
MQAVAVVARAYWVLDQTVLGVIPVLGIPQAVVVGVGEVVGILAILATQAPVPLALMAVLLAEVAL